MDKNRPALILTRDVAHADLHQLTVAPITSSIRGIATEVSVGVSNGLDRASVINCDLITTVSVHEIGPCIGYLLSAQEASLTEAIRAAFLLA